jgi:hypothetical protein
MDDRAFWFVRAGGRAGRGGAGGAGVARMTVTSPEGRLSAALELLGEVFGVQPPEPEDRAGVVLFLTETVCALVLERKTLSATRQGRRTAG